MKVCRFSSFGKVSKYTLALVGAFTLILQSIAVAGTDMKEITPVTAKPDTKDWTIELGSGCAWSNVRTGPPNQSYTIVPIDICASYKLDDVSLDHFLGGWLRGYTEFYFRGDYAIITHGPESQYEGPLFGPRYNFVQPGWKIIPFVEGGVGIIFSDSNPQAGGLGQDFNFSFDVAAGAKYMVTDDFFIRASVEYRHISNAGLSSPTPNNQIDALGPKLSFGYAF